MKKKLVIIGIGFLILTMLTGCLFPKNELAKNKIPNEVQLEMVEEAVLQFRDETDGLMPIKTKEADVPKYEKYLIDFTKLKERQLISEIPGTAYENGGMYQYVIVNPEEDPKVKLIDLRITEAIRSVNVKLNAYRTENLYPPFGEEVADGLFTINYKKLGMKSSPEIISPFSQTNLPLVMNIDGEIFVDYRIDLQQAIEAYDHSFDDGDEITSILVQHYAFVPAYSMDYTIKDGEVEFLNSTD